VRFLRGLLCPVGEQVPDPGDASVGRAHPLPRRTARLGVLSAHRGPLPPGMWLEVQRPELIRRRRPPVRQSLGRKGQAMVSWPGLGDLLDLPPLAQGELRRRPSLYLGYNELNPSAWTLWITSRTRSSPVNATLAIEGTSMRCAEQHHLRPPPGHYRPAIAPHDLHQPASVIIIDLTNPQPIRHRPSLGDQHHVVKTPQQGNVTCYGISSVSSNAIDTSSAGS
jgi:hypothetical protein